MRFSASISITKQEQGAKFPGKFPNFKQHLNAQKLQLGGFWFEKVKKDLREKKTMVSVNKACKESMNVKQVGKI